LKYLLYFVIIFVLSSSHLYTQSKDSLGKYLKFEDAGGFDFLLTYFPSFYLQNSIELKKFVRSKIFKKIRLTYGDVKAMDAVFIRSMALTKNNTAISLLISTLACFDHQLVGLKNPVLSIFFPLTSESEVEFYKRVENLPAHIYDDSPRGKIGDRDKLQHFFGSAFISFVFESRDPVDRTARFIELFEDAVIIDGAYDERDLRANCQGSEFGFALLKNNHRLPSEFIKGPCHTDKFD